MSHRCHGERPLVTLATTLALELPMNLLDVLGLRPFDRALAQAKIALTGMPGVPASRFGPSSLGVLHPRLAIPTWLGRRVGGDKVVVTNLFNRTQTPICEGWSVRKTRVRDFRGGALSYDSHNGVDLAVPPGTTVVAPAPGRVVRVSSEFNRGGLKVVLDHGEGLMTTSNHLARALVRPGAFVARGEPIALSGASGVDAVLTFPFNCPHVHFNTWLDGEPVDPFAAPGETALWYGGNTPGPAHDRGPEPWTPTPWDPIVIDRLIALCPNPELRRELELIEDPDLRAANLCVYRNYYPTLFSQNLPLVVASLPEPRRRPRLDLPFSDFTGIVFADELRRPAA